MSEIYVARDPRLRREVAVKLLSPDLLGNADRLRRFEREARSAASINHPNVLVVHDVGAGPEGPYIVSELLAGESLDRRLERGPVRPRQAIRIVAAAARGLAAAHRVGVIHRDLKPSNIFLTSDGGVKLLDFGVAKLLRPDGDPPGERGAAVAGQVFGTPNYMSPEQARGEPTDARSDIFALGAILYELLSGEPAFAGASAAETMTAIVHEDPQQLDELTSRLPLALGDVLGHCLEKDPEERYQSAKDLAFHLESIHGMLVSSASEGFHGVEASPSRRSARRLAAVTLTVAIAALAAWLGFRLRNPSPQLPRLRTLTFSGSDSNPSALSGGSRVVFTSGRDGARRIWLKEMSQGSEVVLTAGPDSVARISPDGAQVLFVREEPLGHTLYRLPVVGGNPRRLLPQVRQADWSPDGRQVVFLRRVQGQEGPAAILGVIGVDDSRWRKLTDLPTPLYNFPRWSPDGHWIALGHGGAGVPGIVLLVPSKGGSPRVLDTGMAGRVHGVAWSGNGSLLVAQADAPSAGQRTTPGRIQSCRIDGRCRAILHVEQIGMGLDVLGDGALVFGTESTSQSLLEVSLHERDASERWLTRGAANDRQPVYSPDGEWIAFASERAGNLDLWAVSRTTGELRRLTDSSDEDWDPAWTADGRRLLWSSNRSGHFEIWMGAADGSSPRRITGAGANFQNPTVTPDGVWITFVSFDDATRGLWKIRPDGSDSTRLVAGDLRHPELSPDGRFVLFHRPLPGGMEQIQVVRLDDGGAAPFEIRIPAFSGAGRGRWLPDGNGVAFVGLDDRGQSGVYVQDFRPGQNTDTSRRPVAGFQRGLWTESFGISPDGRFMTLALKRPQMSLTVAENVQGVTARHAP